jgi:hypothetical protein
MASRRVRWKAHSVSLPRSVLMLRFLFSPAAYRHAQMEMQTMTYIPLAKAMIAAQTMGADPRSPVLIGTVYVLKVGDGRVRHFNWTMGADTAEWRENPDSRLGYLRLIRRTLIQTLHFSPRDVDEALEVIPEWRHYWRERTRHRARRRVQHPCLEIRPLWAAGTSDAA